MARKGACVKAREQGYAHDVNAMEAALTDALRPPAGRPSSLLDARVSPEEAPSERLAEAEEVVAG
jgi:hypothetical protein